MTVYWSRTFPGLRDVLGEVQKSVTDVAGGTPHADRIIEAVLLLADNAIMHSLSGEEGGKLEVQITCGDDFWRIRVDDSGSVASQPYRRRREAGVIHGLDRLHEIATHWGVLGSNNAHAVWAEFWHDPPTG